MKEISFKKYYQDRSLRSHPNEKWVPVYHEDFSEFYEVSNKGRIKSLPREKRRPGKFVRFYVTKPLILKQTVTKKKGRIVDCRVQLNNGEYVKTFQISRLIYFSFNRNEDPETDDFIIHKNKEGYDNRLRNLLRGDRSKSRQIDMEKSIPTIKYWQKMQEKGGMIEIARKAWIKKAKDATERNCYACKERKPKDAFYKGRYECKDCMTKRLNNLRKKTKQLEFQEA